LTSGDLSGLYYGNVKTKIFETLVMKNLTVQAGRCFGVAAILLFQVTTGRATDIAGETRADQPVTVMKLPYGVDDVIKLSRAKISEDIILSYIQNSGRSYDLGPKEIVYLRDQGVSDRVVSVMLERKTTTDTTAAQTPAPAASPQVAYPDTAPPPTYIQPAPAYVPASTVYVIPNSSTYPYYGSYYGSYYGGYRPYYSCAPYYGYGGGYRFSYPALSFNFGFGGRGHFSHHRR